MGKFKRRNDDFDESETFEERFNARKNRFTKGAKRGGSRGPREFQRTKVTCASCGKKCEVPFKPTSNKPVYCEDCFGEGGKSSKRSFSRDSSNANLDEINEKLDKIMRALKIR